jgi:hypothetical protein
LEVLNIVLPLIIFIFILSLRRAGCILWWFGDESF